MRRGKKEKEFTINRSQGIKAFFSSIWDNKMSRIGLIILIFFLAIAIFGPMLLENPKSDYAARLQGPSWQHPLGTDFAGKDTLVQLILGSRDVLLVAAYTAIFAITFACTVGVVSGLFGGKIDTFLMMITNIIITIPSFPVTMILSMVISINNQLTFGLVLSLWSWAGLAKAIRSQVMLIKHKDFIEASRIMGLKNSTIIINDILPNIVSYIAVNFIAIMKGAILASVGLMYLGLVPFQGNHWGMMINLALSQTGALLGSSSMIYFLAPVVSIVVFQLGCYLFATGLDEALNPRLRS
ncbi:ABC transporter permease [Turicibacter sanguinis]|uniref:ABC transporter permease n=1 Tax=Turicibacter sanguinis TaxID=154288 RepID=UPI0021D51992|nr:ABC transporter permease [Turicibacter sanguinis]MCU7202505.1 ABC transporter permease [Turicibacter sanguinis]